MFQIRRHSITTPFLIGMLLLTVIAAVILWGQWYLEREQRFEKNLTSFREEYIDREKALVREEINSALDFIRFNRERFESRSQMLVKARTYEAHDIATHLYRQYHGKKPDAEIFSLIKEALRPIRFNNGRGYFFATNLDGTEELFADHPEMEGKNLLDVKDTRGVPIIREMIELVKTKGETFYYYTWSKPQQAGQSFPKISFVKYFAPANWFIGTGEYLDDLETDSKQQVLKRINDIRFGEDGYIFVLDSDSMMLANRLNPQLVGQRMNTSDNQHYRNMVRQMMQVTELKGHGFVEYGWPKPDGSGESHKITYVARVPKWGWLLGTGFHLDELETQIAARRAALKHIIFRDIFSLTILLVLVGICAYVLSRLIARKIQHNIALFNSFFTRAALSSGKISEQEIAFAEFDQLAQAANRMIEERDQAEREKRQLEAQLLQKQKLEAIGTLAGGIAHDFNNLLAAIIGNLSLLSLKIPKDDQRRIYLDRLEDATGKARDMVTQILSFSRFTEGKEEIVDLREVVENALPLLRSSIPSSIAILHELPDAPCPVRADRTQLHQVLMNLCNNAQQAMPGSRGIIRIRLALIGPEEQQRPILPSAAGAPGIAHLQVSDDGVGIPPEILDRIFDPFFTTKGIGQGTGLGLAVAHRIINSFRGQISAESSSEGTSLHVYLPLIEAVAASAQPIDQPLPGEGRILLIDDDPAVLESTTEQLQQLGYQVIPFQQPERALTYLQDHAAEIQILITDQTMPGMSGLDLIRAGKAVRQDLPIVLCTGFSDQIDEQTAQEQGICFLMKPVTLVDLSRTLKEILES